jgi:hypothetical protein
MQQRQHGVVNPVAVNLHGCLVRLGSQHGSRAGSVKAKTESPILWECTSPNLTGLRPSRGKGLPLPS